MVKVMTYLRDIKIIVSRHGGVNPALSDTEGKHALMMCLLQIGELLNRLKDPDMMTVLDVPKVVAFRNLIAYEYDSMMLNQIALIIEKNLPTMEKLINSRLREETDYSKLEALWKRSD